MKSAILIGAAMASMVVLLLRAASAGGLPPNLSLRYDVFLIGAHIYTLEINANLAEGRYTVGADMQTRGALGFLVPWNWTGRSMGAADSGKLVPAQHRSESIRGERRRWTELTYGGPAHLSARRGQVDPVFVAPNMTEFPFFAQAEAAQTDSVRVVERVEQMPAVPVEYRRDTVDLLSAVAWLLDGVARRGECAGAGAIFDGKRRYDLVVGDTERVTLSKDDGGDYAGPALLCRVSFNRIAGFGDGDEVKSDITAPARIWFASAGKDDGLIPVRFQASSSYGELKAYLAPAAR